MLDQKTLRHPSDRTSDPGPVWRVGVLATLVAALSTELVGALARAADVPMRIGGMTSAGSQHVVFPAFAFCTLLSGAFGTVLANTLARRSPRPASAFATVTVSLAVVSLLLPTLISGATMATRLVLVVAHLVAAVIIIPALTRRLRVQGLRTAAPLLDQRDQLVHDAAQPEVLGGVDGRDPLALQDLGVLGGDDAPDHHRNVHPGHA
jgi:hypothetical protein